MQIRRVASCVAVAAVLTVWTNVVRAEEALARAPTLAPAAHDLALLPHPKARLALDLPIAVAAGGAWVALHFAHGKLARTSCPCTPDQLPGFERVAVHAGWAPGETIADVIAPVTMGLPLILLAFVANDGFPGWVSDALLVAESVAVSGLLTQIAKTAFSRPYPYMYGPARFPEQNEDGINYASLWSGHTANPMASAVTFAYLFHRRRPRSPLRYVAWIVGPSLALAAGVLQITDANHFPSDVLVGALVGFGIGLVNPMLHELWSGPGSDRPLLMP